MGVAIAFRFPSGRYHGTAWNGSVNEADVEWPPSPWRILRALVAVWHRKGDRGRFRESILEGLVESLAAEAPEYNLPPAVKSHTRHFMPERSGSGTRPVMVFDAFAAVDRDATLVVRWPSVTLDADEYALLGSLLDRLGYLGRAESWVEGRLIDTAAGEPNCSPADETGGGDGDIVQVLCPRTPKDYAEFRNGEFEARELTKGRLNKGQKRLVATLPQSFLGALSIETADMRNVGWNRPPASQVVPYRRPWNCFGPAPIQHVHRRRSGVTTVRLVLSGNPLPLVEDSLRIGEAARLAAIHWAEKVAGEENVPPVLSGHGLPDGNNHGHAFYLPEDADGDGRLDHILVHAPAGLPPEAVRALDAIPHIWIRSEGKWRSIYEGGWDPTSDVPSRLMATSREWCSATPYLHPWFAKKGFGIDQQVERECRIRGFRIPRVEVLSHIRVAGRVRRPVQFHRFRSRRGGRQPDRMGHFLRLTFDEAISGPLAFGYACHFGLGIFQPFGEW